jgi:hypothetical protein
MSGNQGKKNVDGIIGPETGRGAGLEQAVNPKPQEEPLGMEAEDKERARFLKADIKHLLNSIEQGFEQAGSRQQALVDKYERLTEPILAKIEAAGQPGIAELIDVKKHLETVLVDLENELAVQEEVGVGKAEAESDLEKKADKEKDPEPAEKSGAAAGISVMERWRAWADNQARVRSDYERIGKDVEAVYLKAEKGSEVAVFYDLEGNEIFSQELASGSASERENAKKELDRILASRGAQLEQLEKEGFNKSTLTSIGIEPWLDNLEEGTPAARKLEFMRSHADDPGEWGRALDALRLVRNSGQVDLDYEEVYQHTSVLAGLEGKPEKIKAYLDLVAGRNTEDSLSRLFDNDISGANLSRFGRSYLIHKFAGPAVGLRIKFKGDKILFGLKGPGFKRLNWGRNGWSMRSRADIPFTLENLQEAKVKAAEIRKKAA